MKTQMIRELVTADKNHHLHLDIKLPETFTQHVEVFIVPVQDQKNELISDESMAIMKMTDETKFVQDILLSEEEECWNEALK